MSGDVTEQHKTSGVAVGCSDENPSPLMSYRDRRERQLSGGYPVDMGQRKVCDHCGSIYFVKREVEEKQR